MQEIILSQESKGRNVMKYNYNTIFKELIDQGITKKELAKKAGVSVSTLQHMKEQKPVSIKVLLKIADALNKNLEEIRPEVKEQ